MVRKPKSNTNNTKSEKHVLEPVVIAWCNVRNNQTYFFFKIKFDFHRLDKVKKTLTEKQDIKKNWQRKKLRLSKKRKIGNKFSALVERSKKKDAPRKFY